MGCIEIFWDDLTEEAQKRLVAEGFKWDENFNTFAITTVSMPYVEMDDTELPNPKHKEIEEEISRSERR